MGYDLTVILHIILCYNKVSFKWISEIICQVILKNTVEETVSDSEKNTEKSNLTKGRDGTYF